MPFIVIILYHDISVGENSIVELFLKGSVILLRLRLSYFFSTIMAAEYIVGGRIWVLELLMTGRKMTGVLKNNTENTSVSKAGQDSQKRLPYVWWNEEEKE